MKIQVFNSYSKKGGAARAAHRFCESLISLGVDAQYVCAYQESPSPYQKLKWLIRALCDRLPAILMSKKKIVFSSGGLNNEKLVHKINSSDADLVHLHWVNAGALSYCDIAKINKPIVWSLHDMWLFTGGCHYDEGCGAYRNGCGNCPMLGSKSEKDLSRRNYRAKHKMVNKISNLTVIGLSQWIAESASASEMMKEIEIVSLPNAIDVSIYFPESKAESKIKLDLDRTKKIILFGAMSGTDDPRKGYVQLLDALKSLSHIDNIQLATFGGENNDLSVLDIEIKSLGRISDDATLRTIYSAADVVVVPSLQENLSNVIMESLACGTPVVGFDIGGNADLIQHKSTGYLADLNKPNSLACGIDWVLFQDEVKGLNDNCRKFVVNNFSYESVGTKYLELYRHVLNKSHQALSDE
jgi:glycosyltransferase involved in cell wall biosynthesis